MKALRYSGGRLSLDEMPVPAGESLVRVSLSGICSTDIEITRGYADFEGTLGHEFVGVVERSQRRPYLVGKRVVGEINAGCGLCELCRAGDARHCPQRTVLGIQGRDGSHAEYLTLPDENLIEVPDSITDEAAVFTEPLAAAAGICERTNIDAGMGTAVIGDGRLGLLSAFVLKLRSPDLTLIGKHRSKLALAEKRGIETVDRADAARLGRRFDVIVEASGSASGFETALELVRPRGTIVLKSTFHGLPTWDAARVVVNEISVVGSRCGRFEPALGLLADGTVDVADMISDIVPLEDGVAAFRAASEGGVLKVLLRPGD